MNIQLRSSYQYKTLKSQFDFTKFLSIPFRLQLKMRVVYVVLIGNQLLVEGHKKGTDAKGTNGCKFEALRFRFKNDRSGCKDIQVKCHQL